MEENLTVLGDRADDSLGRTNKKELDAIACVENTRWSCYTAGRLLPERYSNHMMPTMMRTKTAEESCLRPEKTRYPSYLYPPFCLRNQVHYLIADHGRVLACSWAA